MKTKKYLDLCGCQQDAIRNQILKCSNLDGFNSCDNYPTCRTHWFIVNPDIPKSNIPKCWCK